MKIVQRLIVVYLLLGPLLVSVSMADDNEVLSVYRAGFAAYLDKDYDTAQKHWIVSAKQNHARSMFNLGLLHEQGKIANASSSKADDWFALASKHDYIAADYHLGVRWLAQGGRDEEANALLEKAAQAGYVPAVQRVEQRHSPSVLSPGSQTGQLYLREPWIQAKPADYWTIQMLAFKERARVEGFIDKHDLHNNAAFFSEGSGEKLLYKLIYGAYDSKDKADFARQNLPEVLTEYGPWLRPISSVQAVIKRQR